MKKHLIAAAVAAAVAVPAMAQVSLYGSIDASYTSTNNVGADDTGAGTVTSVNSSLLTTSRLGFRGEEDLGGGLKAGFVVESAIRNDSENALTLGDRGAELFVNGGFGELRIGKAAGSDANTVASGPTNLTNFAAGTATRPDNRIQYITPNINGFTFNVALATDQGDDENETDSTKANGKYNSFGFNYAAGALRVMGFQARSSIESARVAGKGAICADWDEIEQIAVGDDCYDDYGYEYTLVPGVAEVAAQDGKIKDTGLLASYNFGVAVGQVRYLRSKTSGDVNTAVDRKTTALDLTIPMADGVTVGLGYMTIKNDADDTDSKKFSLYASKALSKRTNVYAAYASVSNDDKAKLGATGSTTDRLPVNGENQRTIGVGVRHSF